MRTVATTGTSSLDVPHPVESLYMRRSFTGKVHVSLQFSADVLSHRRTVEDETDIEVVFQEPLKTLFGLVEISRIDFRR